VRELPGHVYQQATVEDPPEDDDDLDYQEMEEEAIARRGYRLGGGAHQMAPRLGHPGLPGGRGGTGATTIPGVPAAASTGG
jgi:hypothetical protein